MDLKDTIVVITGGTSGIGLSIVKKLLASCDVKYVAIFELDLPRCRAVFNDLQNDYAERVGFYSCDVTKTSLISGKKNNVLTTQNTFFVIHNFTENLDKVIASHRTIDILINNAGVADESRPELVVDVNLKAVVTANYMLIDRIGKHKGGKGGLIVNIASVLGLINDMLPVYCATKHGVVSFTRTMKVAVCPGFTNTPILTNCNETKDFLKINIYDSPEFYLQTPENVAAAVISIVQNGKPGDVWVSEHDKPPYSVGSIEDHRSLKIKDYSA